MYSTLFTLERVVEGGTLKNLPSMIVNDVCYIGGLSLQIIRENFITFGVDGVSILQVLR